MLEKFNSLPGIWQALLITVFIFGVMALFIVLVRLIAQKAVERELSSMGIMMTSITGMYASQAVYAVNVSNISPLHPLSKYALFAEEDGNLLLRVIGGKHSSDYPPTWPEHKLRCAIEAFGSHGIFPPGKPLNANIVELKEKELTLVTEEDYENYLQKRFTKSRS